MAKTENKSQKFMGYILLLIAGLIFIHSGMGVNQYKHWLSMHDEKHNTSLPFDIIIECLCGLITALISINFFIGREFLEIINTSEAKLRSMDGLAYSEDFTIFKRRRPPISLQR